MIWTLLNVAVGGAAGAMARFGLGVAVMRATGPTAFPIAVLAANVLGSFLMGVFVVLAARWGLTYLSPLVMTGLLGGFTTFSAFSLETMTLWERGDVGLAALYVVLSICLSVGALGLGLWLMRATLS